MKHMTYEERKIMEKVFKNGGSLQDAANILGRHISTIFREVERAGGQPYDAMSGQARANLNKRKVAETISKVNARDNYERVLACMQEHPEYNREQISKKVGLSYQTVSKYMDRVLMEQSQSESNWWDHIEEGWR